MQTSRERHVKFFSPQTMLSETSIMPYNLLKMKVYYAQIM
jgi:hypothetical protein